MLCLHGKSEKIKMRNMEKWVNTTDRKKKRAARRG